MTLPSLRPGGGCQRPWLPAALVLVLQWPAARRFILICVEQKTQKDRRQKGELRVRGKGFLFSSQLGGLMCIKRHDLEAIGNFKESWGYPGNCCTLTPQQKHVSGSLQCYPLDVFVKTHCPRLLLMRQGQCNGNRPWGMNAQLMFYFFLCFACC